MDAIGQDIRYAIRALRRSPGFAAAAVLTLTLGIGANTAIFSVVNAALLRPLPYPDPDRLVVVGTQNGDLSPGDFLDVAAQTHVFEQVAAYRSRPMVLSGTGEPERISGATTTPGLITLLGVRPMLGRALEAGSSAAAGGREALLGYGLWQRRFAGRPDLIGESITLDGEPVTVVGVMPPAFAFPAGEELWATPRAGFPVPEHPLRPLENPAAARGTHYFETVGRLRPGLSMDRAQAELDLVFAQIAGAHPDSDLKKARSSLETLHQSAVGDARPALLLLLGAVGLVLLIACANVANLTLARGNARIRELAVRDALGAGRMRLLRLLLVESAVLALLAAGLGTTLALWGVGALSALLPSDLSGVASVRIDGHVLAFTLALCLLAALAFGLWPALAASKPDPNAALKEGGQRGGGRHRARGVLIVAETALALLLLVGAGLLLKSLFLLLAVDEGFRPDHLLTLRIWLPTTTYARPEDRARFAEDVVRTIEALPGCASAAVVTRLPLHTGNSNRSFAIEGRSYPADSPAEPSSPDYSAVSPGYFRTMGIPLVAGRDFEARDAPGAPPVVIVNRAAARRYWPGEDPIGRHLKIGGATDPGPWITVVGVAGDVRQHDLAQSAPPMLYAPYALDPWTFLTVAVRTVADPASAATAVTTAIHHVDPGQAVYDVRTMEGVVARSLAPRRANALLIGVFAGLALALAAVGVFSVTSLAVGERTREIGVRRALGASSAQVLGLVLLGSMRLAGAGVVLGMAGALGLQSVLGHLLFGVEPTDGGTFTAVAVLLLAVVLLASWLPARRAIRVEPVAALRYE